MNKGNAFKILEKATIRLYLVTTEYQKLLHKYSYKYST